MAYKHRPCIQCGVATVCNSSRPAICNDECRKARAKEYVVEYHFKHKEKRNKNALEKRRSNKKKAVEYLGGKCIDCNKEWPLAVYDFHHLDPSQKDIPASWLMNWNWGVQQKELDKCVLLCANCHRLRHHKDF